MKTPEQWYKKEFFNISDLDEKIFVELCKQIQQEAYKEGYNEGYVDAREEL